VNAIDDTAPILQLTRHGAVWRDAEGTIPRLRQQFSDRHCVRLPALIEPSLLERIHVEVGRAAFRELAHGEIATELAMVQPSACVGLLHFLVNDSRMYRLIEDVSQCRPIRRFFGRIYRRLPNGSHHDSWHSDVHDERQIGMSVNLSTDIYEGGVFEIRDADSQTTLDSIANTGFGDAILFRISPSLEHRVTDIRGAFPKTAFAGWFGATRDYLATLRDDPFLPGEP
jgi:hypothetical protein